MGNASLQVKDATGQIRSLTANDTPVDEAGSRVIPTADRLIARVAGVDLKSVATTALYTVSGGRTLIVTKVRARITAASGVSSDAAAGVGVAGGEDDVFASRAMIQVRAVGDLYWFVASDKSRAVLNGETVNFGVDTGATATTLTGEVELWGYFTSDPVSAG